MCSLVYWKLTKGWDPLQMGLVCGARIVTLLVLKKASEQRKSCHTKYLLNQQDWMLDLIKSQLHIIAHMVAPSQRLLCRLQEVITASSFRVEFAQKKAFRFMLTWRMWR